MPNAGGLPGLEGSEWLPGGHVQVEMVMEGVDLPLAMQVSVKTINLLYHAILCMHTRAICTS